MKRTPITLDCNTIPSQFHALLADAPIFDSSCSPEARVWFIDRNGGYFLKSSQAGTLREEAEMTAFFRSRSMGAEVLAYFTESKDWLLTRRIPGEDCLDPKYISQPERLAELLAEQLLQLHSIPAENCPVSNRTERYLTTARRNYEAKAYDTSLFPDNWGYDTPEAAWKVIEENGHLLKSDTLIHGDYCLPNIMLDDWHFSAFLDVGNGGMGDKHIDLFWGAWSLGFNLHDDRYGARFLDAYGRHNFEEEMLSVVAACEVFG